MRRRNNASHASGAINFLQIINLVSQLAQGGGDIFFGRPFIYSEIKGSVVAVREFTVLAEIEAKVVFVLVGV
ncbi:MAG TPA: hypothetical protein ENG80_04445 [Nitrospirae bacterium]|nr:hypothetical protein [Nitrospirota bacterium]